LNAEPLERRLACERGDDDFAVIGTWLPANHHDVAIEDSAIAHAEDFCT
jgi:hypothetical protein